MRNDERPYLRVEIFGKPFLGLLDTGATRTILGQRGIENIASLGLKVKPSQVLTCNVANGEACDVVGSYELPFKVLNRIILLEVLVVPSVSHMLILGVDFFKRMGIVPDLRNNHWTFSEQVSQPCVATLMDNSRLNSGQQERLNALVDGYFSGAPDKLGCTTFVGPFVVAKKTSPWAYELEHPDGRPAGLWNTSDLKADPNDSE
ncbi:hypothetical protein NQ317_008068 [Molorchus minor]|uniref:Peptidase A2 domain-containing protein n=1 Tax=Molorchus minor TaxID=1323400 RepID=A0ABQ9J3T9_9CUCU|nr:hypothetical protein NQ317_008068 [Molorchus minor]